MYLLDTNHCSRLLQGHPAIINKLKELDDAPVATCAIVRGELMFMAQKSEQKVANLRRIHEFLDHILTYPIDEETADIYGALKAAIVDYFGPKEKAQRRQTEITRLGFSENDLWIAATAKRYDLTIVSADSDFTRIQEVEELSIETWWRPEYDR